MAEKKNRFADGIDDRGHILEFAFDGIFGGVTAAASAPAVHGVDGEVRLQLR